MLQDTELLAKLAGGSDMVAIDGEYHPKCLAALYNRERQHEISISHEKSDTDTNNISHGIAFAELISFLEECRDDPELASVFTLAELVQMYSNRLQELGVELSSKINSTRLKERLLDVFPDLQAYNEGRNVKLIFNEDIGAAIRKACAYDSDDDAAHLAKAAQIIRRDIIKTQQTLNGTFSPNCQEKSVPASLSTLIDLILEGPNIKKQSRAERVTKALVSPYRSC